MGIRLRDSKSVGVLEGKRDLCFRIDLLMMVVSILTHWKMEALLSIKMKVATNAMLRVVHGGLTGREISKQRLRPI